MAMSFSDQPTSTSSANTGIHTDPIPEKSRKPGSSITDAERLIQALRNIIIPLARPADGRYQRDINETALGLDGKEFVIALENFMTSFLGSQWGPVRGIEVDLEERGINIPDAEHQTTSGNELDILDIGAQATSNDDLSSPYFADVAPEMELPVDSSAAQENICDQDLWSILPFHNEESPEIIMAFFKRSTSISHTDRFGRRKSRFTEKALNILRKHVFNTMPIRLLCFKPHASKFQITLIERGEISAHIASNFLNSINAPEISRNITYYEIDDGSEEAAELINKYCQYAILSHTWLRGEAREVTYGDWIRGDFDVQLPGYQKLVNFCRIAWKDYGIAFGWMDTVCINKESSTELDESIRSMYKWYQCAHTCITYLAETVKLPDMHNDNWFTRGWTLQELIAPSHIKFYNAHWKKLVASNENDKENSIIQKEINEATTITENELHQPITFIPVSRKMQMAAKRQVTREEDSAYSLMGILNISISIAYGEGASRAFTRLLLETFNTSSFGGVADIFNWAGLACSHISSLLPYSPRDYLHHSPSLDISIKPVEPIILTHLGLRITTLLMPAISIKNPTESQCEPYGNYHATTDIDFHDETMLDNNIIGGCYSVLDARLSDRDGWNEHKTWFQLTLGIVNVADGTEEKIALPTPCLAVALRYNKSFSYKYPTKAPIAFTLNKRRGPDESIHGPDDSIPGFDHIKRSDLGIHGMKLVTIIL